MPISTLLCLLCIGLVSGPLGAAPGDQEAGDRALLALARLLPEQALVQGSSFQIRGIRHDPLLGTAEVRVQQQFQGVRVFGGEAIVRLGKDATCSITDALARQLRLGTLPTLTPSEAAARALDDLAPKGRLAAPPQPELVILRPGKGLPVTQDSLAYRIHTALENGRTETAHTDYLIDAQTGAILKKWDSLHTIGSIGTGHSQFSGQVALDTTKTKTGYELRDLTRGKGGNTVQDLGGGTADSGPVYSNDSNDWGDGENYNGGATTSANGQTAAVDAAFGSSWTWDYYKNVHHRDGIDGKGTATSMRVHYDRDYDNAYWSDACFCMTFGDGRRFKSLEALDVVGHEMSHGVCASTANLEYFGESGGLNEANSDIHGAMVEFYARGGMGYSIGEQGGDWTMGEALQTEAFKRPIRWMYKPSKDGRSPDAWQADIGNLNVHYSSGPMNRAFYFLSQGASANPASEYASSYLPEGMSGLGNDRAARLWYWAMTSYMTSLTDYAGARSATISAAKDSYGAGSQEEQAVWNAFHGINVGESWPTAPRSVQIRISVPARDLDIANGTSVAFEANSAPDLTRELVYSWTFGDGATATASRISHTFRNQSPDPLQYVVTLRATDPSGAFAEATRLIRVQP